MPTRVAYCTGFWCTNIGNAFFSLGVEYVLKQILGKENVTVVSDYQTYTTSYGKRLYPHKNQLEYITKLDVDLVIFAGPVLSKYFLPLWEDILLKLEKRGVKYGFLSAGMMKMNEEALQQCKEFFSQHPPYILSSRERKTFDTFGNYAIHAYDGICFAFFAPDYYTPCKMIGGKNIVLNFDKISEPEITIGKTGAFELEKDIKFDVRQTGLFNKFATKTDRFSDALIYIQSVFPQKKMPDKIGDYTIIRTDHRFHPHFRNKIYAQNNSFCADLPYGYLNLYANSDLTLSDRVHACAVTLAYGHRAMLFVKTNRVGLLDRVGATEVTYKPVKLDLQKLELEKKKLLEWLKEVLVNKN